MLHEEGFGIISHNTSEMFSSQMRQLLLFLTVILVNFTLFQQKLDLLQFICLNSSTCMLLCKILRVLSAYKIISHFKNVLLF